ncbi:hypothetical protein OAX78_04145 [Planctomycetota bacterium]|nr:hypothetical protein [Planctomycetota bacterium]
MEREAPLRFNDEAPQPEADAGADVADFDSGVQLLDASPLATAAELGPRPEPPAVEPLPTFEVPKRRVAVPPKESGPRDAGFAMCPACEAKNPTEAAVCARCGEHIPPPVPVDFSVAMTHRRRTRIDVDPGDPGAAADTGAGEIEDDDISDVIPDHVKAQFAATAGAVAARQAAHAGRVERYRRTVTIGCAGLLVLLGLMPSIFSMEPEAILLSTVFDAALGAAAGNLLVRRKGGRHVGIGVLAAAGGLSLAFKMPLGVLEIMFSSMAGAVIFAVVVAMWGFAICAGSMLGLSVHQFYADEIA